RALEMAVCAVCTMKTCTYLSNNMRSDLLVSIARRNLTARMRWPFAGSLDVGRVRRSIAAKQDRGACHAFIADQSDFDPRVIGLHRHDGSYARIRQVDVVDAAVGPFQFLTKP